MLGGLLNVLLPLGDMETILEANLMDKIEMSYNLLCFTLGVPMCKAMRFAESLSFSISSNIVVCIAVNRYYALKHPIQSAFHWEERVRALAVFSWICAISFSLPQLFVWDVYRLDSNYTQCLNIWVKAKAESALAIAHGVNITSTDIEYSNSSVRLYEMYHLMVIFWIPLTFLVSVYALIIREMYSTMTSNAKTKNCCRSSFPVAPPETEQLRRNSRALRTMKRVRWKALRTTLILMTAYTLCWFPYNSLALWGVIHPESYIQHENTVYILHGFVVLNSVLNPCIYGSAFRRAICARNNRPFIQSTIPAN
ncbi:unnamed protein product [Toxocara canis]|uniref:G_PROTEIN_RECEP_F1_2 domain-containing protein n=1 Tax=Toxocara canis TaxID=6265 RepID=A0A183V3P3_TOXCA|nr:unnamed protein product [Toxocara canis]